MGKLMLTNKPTDYDDGGIMGMFMNVPIVLISFYNYRPRVPTSQCNMRNQAQDENNALVYGI